MKTNKSYAKRLKVTKKGKVVARKSGQNHFNAKESRAGKMDRRRTTTVTMSNKSKARFIAK